MANAILLCPVSTEPFGALLWQAPALAVGRSHACATACTTTVADGAGPSPDAWCPPRNDQKRLCPDMASHVQLQLLQLQSTPRRLQSWIPTGDHNAHGRAHPHVLPRTFAGPDAARPPLGLTPKLAPPHCHHLAEHGHQQFAHHLTHIAAGELRDGQVPDCHPAPGSASHIAVGHAVLDLGAQPQHRQQQQQHHDHQQLGSSALSAPSAPWFCGQGHHASAPGGGLGLAAHPTRQTDVWTALRTGWTVSRRHELPGAPSGSEQRGTMQSATGPGPSGSGAGAGTDTPGTGPVSGGSATEVGSSTGTGTDAGSGSGAGGSGSDDEAEPPPVPLDPDVKPPGLLFVTGGAAASGRWGTAGKEGVHSEGGVGDMREGRAVSSTRERPDSLASLISVQAFALVAWSQLTPASHLVCLGACGICCMGPLTTACCLLVAPLVVPDTATHWYY